MSPAPYVAAAVHFDGNTYLSINSLSSTDNGALSFSFWAREDNQTGLWSNGFFWLLPTNTSAIKPSAVLSNAPLLWQLFKGPTGLINVFFCTAGPISSAGWHYFLGSCQTNRPPKSLYFNYVDASSDGRKLVAAIWGDHIYTSNDSGATWTAKTTSESASWLGIACSSDGQVILSGNTNGHSQSSTDGGSTWKTHAGMNVSGASAVSADGKQMFLLPGPGAANRYPSDYLYKSTDSGSSFSRLTAAGSRRWERLNFLSSDGQNLIAAVYNDYLYSSTDGGTIWTQQTGAGTHRWQKIAHSSDGQTVVAVFLGASGSGGYAITRNGGSTWTVHTGYTDMAGVAMSSNGQTIIFSEWTESDTIAIYGHVWISRDGGSTLTRTSLGPGEWNDVTCSLGGTEMTAISNSVGLWHSTNSGATWNQAILNANSKLIKFYVDNVDVTSVVSDVWPSFIVPTNGSPMKVGTNGSGSQYLGDMADYWFAPGVSLLVNGDIPIETRGKFINNGKPVDPKSFPVGGAVLFTGDASVFGTNQLAGGAFTTTGRFTNASTHP